MKILHIIHKKQHRGAETFACQLAIHQKNLGHEVRIVAIYAGNANLNWEDSIDNISGTENNLVDWRAWKRLATYIMDMKPDIVQANSGDTLKYAVFSKKLFGWKNLIIFRNASEVGRYLKSGIQKRLNSFLYQNVSGVISVSKVSEKDLLNHFPFLKNKTRIIAVGLEDILPNHLVLEPKDKKHIIHVGGFSFEKNHKELILIFKKVLKKKPDTYLHLIGDGKLKGEIKILVENEGIQDKVVFYGFVNNPLDYINAGDVLVLPSIIEGLPGVLLESMYCKTPVIAYNVGGVREIVTSHTGMLIDKHDDDSFVKAILENLEKPNLDQVKSAHKRVTEDFMNLKIAGEFLEFYEKVIGKFFS